MIPKFVKKRAVDGYAALNLYFMLLSKDHVSNPNTQEFISQVSANEIVDQGGVYPPGGIQITGKVGQYDGTNAFLDATNNPSIGPGAYLDYRYIAIYVNTGNPADSWILAIIDMEEDQKVSNGTSTINWNSLGIIYKE